MEQAEPRTCPPAGLDSLLTVQFTGWRDPNLTEQGEQEALKGAEELKKAGLVRIV